MLTCGSLFSGIGGLDLGLEWAGVGPVLWQVEQSAFCRSVLARHWPDVDRSVRDVCKAGATTLPRVDVVHGGFPCQDVSSAGAGAGLDGARSGLWYEFARVVSELRPDYAIVENVASGTSRWLCPVRSGLRALGYRTRAFKISAADVGAPQKRTRIFVLAYANGVAIRLEPERLEPERLSGGRKRGVRGGGEVVAECDGTGRDVAHANGHERDDEARGQAAARGERARWAEPRGAGEQLAHSEGPRLEGPGIRGRPAERGGADRVAYANPRGLPSEWDCRELDAGDLAQLGDDADRRGCPGGAPHNGRPSPEPGLGRNFARLPARLDRGTAALPHRWPAGPDEPQYPGEPARAVWPGDYAAERLAALGNAVVPQCAEVIGRILLEMIP